MRTRCSGWVAQGSRATEGERGAGRGGGVRAHTSRTHHTKPPPPPPPWSGWHDLKFSAELCDTLQRSCYAAWEHRWGKDSRSRVYSDTERYVRHRPRILHHLCLCLFPCWNAALRRCLVSSCHHY